ncbi:uncharacterized protein TNIN_331911 [Trichonephila inaurata madagascariensis]|uniref:Gustatory receptor n=1 Tax=Trichonephila inaurata madagascariensis TaxID=2747483 RepID=A0A8X7CPT4_9ARAC|nr:uncharacterized protein TNIN_331911 [Trichonephila inaurata madagascariensis]
MPNPSLVKNKEIRTYLNSNFSICRQTQTKWPNGPMLQETGSIIEKYNIPIGIIAFLCFAGFVQTSDEKGKTLKLWPIFHFLLYFTVIDYFLMTIISFEPFMLKVNSAFILAMILILVICFSMRLSRRRLNILLLKIQYLPPSPEEKMFHLLIPILFLIHVGLSATSAFTAEKYISTIFAYGKELKTHWARLMLIFFKDFLLLLICPFLPCFIALVYCTICLRCSSFIRNMAHKIALFCPEQFGPSEQIRILRHMAKIDEVLKIAQDIFSVPSFCLMLANTISCYTILGCYLLTPMPVYQLMEYSVIGISSFLCLIATLWSAGALPVELNNLKETFYEKTYLRRIFFEFYKEQNFMREILEKPDFVFSGCDILFYKRSSILAAVGTLITYTVLVINVN